MSAGKHLILVGAGHAHLTTIKSVELFTAEGFRVTVVNPGTYQYYSGMGPGLLSGYYHPGETRFNVAAMSEAHGAAFVQNSVVRIDAANRRLHLSGGAEMEYDVASFGVGSEIGTAPMDATPSNIVTVKPVEHLFELRCRVRADLRDRPVRVVVVGGGAAGVEL
ncbi:MAG: FAD-dependent oxidoreductase, partial [bacterium]|nr:FAD-dependent oxidoreductase [bacterium]